MKRPIIEETELKEKHRMATIWQQVEDGVAEQAIHARTWDGGDNKPLVELKQGNESILLNGETLRDLAKLIIGLAERLAMPDLPAIDVVSPASPAGQVLASASCCGGLHWAQIMARDVKRKLMVMPSNNSSAIVHYWAGRYDGRIGWLVGPSAMKKTKLRPWMPFALDNDAFASWTTGRPWDEAAWLAMLGNVRAQGLAPRWVLVPDVVADRDATLAKWEQYAPVAGRYGWPLAIAVQDGMTPADIPANAEVIFIGGTTEWKWRSLPMWARTGARVHVGRVNAVERLHICERWRVESVDGTGWMRGTENGRQAKALGHWLEGKALPHRELPLAA